jgi:murein DD-endopeptidase MepM/ murein hydrolase activator NlpD
LKGRSNRNARRWTGASILAVIASTAAALGGTAGIAAAQDTTTATPSSGATAAPPSGSRSLTLNSEEIAPDKVFYYGKRKAAYRYSIGGNRSRNLKIQAVQRKSWHVVRTWRRSKVKPGKVHTIRWSGSGKSGRPVPRGTYLFRVLSRRGQAADRGRTNRDDRSFGLFPYKFPVRASHTYGDGYGAPRSGHVHQGQDILTQCGKRIVAARGGRVQYRAYQAGGAGYYMVVDGKGTGHDYVYMHLRRRGRPKRGKHVHTGQRIGFVGRTGAATACHLHFEMWTRRGWYEGGRPMPSVTRHLKDWDSWS